MRTSDTRNIKLNAQIVKYGFADFDSGVITTNTITVPDRKTDSSTALLISRALGCVPERICVLERESITNSYDVPLDIIMQYPAEEKPKKVDKGEKNDKPENHEKPEK